MPLPRVQAHLIEDMDVPGFRLHPLKGERRGRWSVWVNGNWRLTFEFRDGRELAAKLDVAPSTLNRILTGASGISPEMALRLSKALGRSPESWLAMQYNHDLWQARQHVKLGNVGRVRLTAA